MRGSRRQRCSRRSNAGCASLRQDGGTRHHDVHAGSRFLPAHPWSPCSRPAVAATTRRPLPVLLPRRGTDASGRRRRPGRRSDDARAALRRGDDRSAQASRGVAAVLRRPTEAYRSPGRTAFARFGLHNVNGVPTTFRVLRTQIGADCRPALVPRPAPRSARTAPGAGSAASAARRYVVDYRILVDLSDRVVTVFKAGQRYVRTATAVGSARHPDADGQLLRQPAAAVGRPVRAVRAWAGSGSRRSRRC